MHVSPSRFVLAAMFVCTSSCWALAHPRHAVRTNANVRHITAHGHRAEHAAVHHEAVRIMDAERATVIQSALIKNGYMTGEPTGAWDASSASAMQKLQADNGWQTKIVPDSRALIKLGLGPQNTASIQ